MPAVTSRPHPLFGSIVLFGTALGGCGGNTAGNTDQTQVDGSTSDGGTGGAGGAPQGGSGGAGGIPQGGAGGADGAPTQFSDCEYAVQFRCDGPDGSCRCDLDAPHYDYDCAAQYQFVCELVDPFPVGCHCDESRLNPADCPNPTQWRCPQGGECFCDAMAPDGPDGCADPAQFQCDFWQLVPTGCRCDPLSPVTSEACMGGDYFSCQSYEPPTGCECVCCVIR